MKLLALTGLVMYLKSHNLYKAFKSKFLYYELEQFVLTKSCSLCVAIKFIPGFFSMTALHYREIGRELSVIR